MNASHKEESLPIRSLLCKLVSWIQIMFFLIQKLNVDNHNLDLQLIFSTDVFVNNIHGTVYL